MQVGSSNIKGADLTRFIDVSPRNSNPGLESPGSQPISDEYAWPPYTSPDLEYKVLDLNLTTSRALKSNECYFWNNYVPQLRSALGMETVARWSKFRE